MGLPSGAAAVALRPALGTAAAGRRRLEDSPRLAGTLPAWQVLYLSRRVRVRCGVGEPILGAGAADWLDRVGLDAGRSARLSGSLHYFALPVCTTLHYTALHCTTLTTLLQAAWMRDTALVGAAQGCASAPSLWGTDETVGEVWAPAGVARRLKCPRPYPGATQNTSALLRTPDRTPYMTSVK